MLPSQVQSEAYLQVVADAYQSKEQSETHSETHLQLERDGYQSQV